MLLPKAFHTVIAIHMDDLTIKTVLSIDARLSRDARLAIITWSTNSAHFTSVHLWWTCTPL